MVTVPKAAFPQPPMTAAGAVIPATYRAYPQGIDAFRRTAAQKVRVPKPKPPPWAWAKLPYPKRPRPRTFAAPQPRGLKR